MHGLALARVKSGFYLLPIEWVLFKTFKKGTFEPIA